MSDVMAFDGRKVKCRGKTNVAPDLEDRQLSLKVLAVD